MRVTTDDITTAITTLPSEATPDQLAEVFNLLNFIKQFEREARARLKELMLEQIEATGQDIVIGTVRHFAGHETSVKGNDNAATMVAMIVACEGDLERVARDALCSDAFKSGFAKQVLSPDLYAKLFTTTQRTVLKEGKPKRQLLTVDERFVKTSSRNQIEVSDEDQ